jgi:hypothetical protein
MPIQKTNGGYKWGKHGKVYPTRAGAAKQARAAYASGYEGYQRGGIIKNQWARDWLRNMGQMGIMSNPKARQLLPLLMGMKQNVPLKNIGKFYAQQAARQAGIKSLLKKYGPSAMYALSNKGGAFGLGTGGPLGQGVLPSLATQPGFTTAKLKWALSNPLFAGIMGLANKYFPGDKGALGSRTGPLMAGLANWASGNRIMSDPQARSVLGEGPMGGTFLPRLKNWGSSLGMQQKPEERGTGIFGGRAGPALADFFGADRNVGGYSSGGGGGTGIFGGTLGPRIASWFGFGDDGDTTTSSKKK